LGKYYCINLNLSINLILYFCFLFFLNSIDFNLFLFGIFKHSEIMYAIQVEYITYLTIIIDTFILRVNQKHPKYVNIQ